MRFFTSDHHFNHKNILKLQPERLPFNDVDYMNEELIRRHNARVSVSDEVYFLGDVLFGGNTEVNSSILSRMHGTKILIKGNHDRANVTKLKSWGFNVVHNKCLLISIGTYYVELRHHPVYEGELTGFLLHGHIHTTEKRRGNKIHVGVDAWDYCPVSEYEIVQLMKESELDDGHT